MVELLRRHDFLPEIGVAGGAGDFRRVQRDIGRATDRHRHDHCVADGISLDDVARLQARLHHVGEITHQLPRELVDPARIVGRRRDHMQRLHADDADEGLQGIISEHAAAAADAGAGVAGDVMPIGGIGMPGDLIGADDVQGFTGLRVCPGVDRAV